ncbi:MAG: ABC transporter ATP-binding protein [Betaproteobacteria bacterium]|nr:ABC transporter ATP-binding protein [Betaproteobacteria bacterium]
MNAAGVEFRGVTRRYGDVVAVDDVTFRIEAGTLTTLVGPSGCGKTTTLRMLAGLEPPDAGTIHIAGRDATRLGAAERDVSLVFQSYALFPHMSVLENVAYGPSVRGQARRAAAELARVTLEGVGLAGLEGRMPSELSGGQQQRVALARALVLEPKVLLFDEPLSNLDARLRRRVREDIRDLQQRLGLTVAYVTHDREEALAVSDRVIVMDRGRIIEQGRPLELFLAPRTAFVADFLGEANLAEARIASVANGRAVVQCAGLSIELDARGHEMGTARLALRPDAVQLAAAREGDAFVGEVLHAAHVGRFVEYDVRTAAGDWFVARPGAEAQHAVGSRVALSLHRDGAVLVD